mgnify:CR=1 FL=1
MEEFGWLHPEMVIEVTFDRVQESKGTRVVTRSAFPEFSDCGQTRKQRGRHAWRRCAKTRRSEYQLIPPQQVDPHQIPRTAAGLASSDYVNWLLLSRTV